MRPDSISRSRAAAAAAAVTLVVAAAAVAACADRGAADSVPQADPARAERAQRHPARAAREPKPTPSTLATAFVKSFYEPRVKLEQLARAEEWGKPVHATWRPGRKVTNRRWAVSVDLRAGSHHRRATWSVHLPLGEILRKGKPISFNGKDVKPDNREARRFRSLPRVASDATKPIALLVGVIDLADGRLFAGVTSSPYDDPQQILQAGTDPLALLRGIAWIGKHPIGSFALKFAVSDATRAFDGSERTPMSPESLARIVQASNGNIINATAVWASPPSDRDALQATPLAKLIITR